MEEENIKNKLAEVPLGEIKELREKVGIKKFNSAFNKQSDTGRNSTNDKDKFKRPNKHRPREMSSRKPISTFRQVVNISKKGERRDPRFDERCGHFNQDLFTKSFDFLKDMKVRELSEVEKELKKTKDAHRREKLQRVLKTAESQEKRDLQESSSKSLEKEHRKVERELSKQGKKPFYLSKALRRKVLLAQKYKELKASGKLNKFLSKKRKKNATRDRKRLPTAS